MHVVHDTSYDIFIVSSLNIADVLPEDVTTFLSVLCFSSQAPKHLHDMLMIRRIMGRLRTLAGARVSSNLDSFLLAKQFMLEDHGLLVKALISLEMYSYTTGR
jgi:hypothetical protein